MVATILEIHQNGLWAQNKEEQVDIDRCEVTKDEFKDSDSGMKKFFSDSYAYAVFPAIGGAEFSATILV